MTLSGNFDDPLSTTESVDNNSINLNSLYCSHLWKNSHLRNAIINAPCSRDKNTISYCYTCKGKIRKYEIKSQKSFKPCNHSTPNKDQTTDTGDAIITEQIENPTDNLSQVVCSNRDVLNDATNSHSKQHIPSISQQIDSSFRHKYVSYESEPRELRQQRLTKNLRGFGCIVNFTSTHNPVKKRTQIQACSISVMIVAIVIISFILVNFTNPYFKGTSKISTTIVPRKHLNISETTLAITNIYSDLQTVTENHYKAELITSIDLTSSSTTETSSMAIISKIRKYIRTYPKIATKEHSVKPKDVNNRELSAHFCSCQNNDICMLDENSGTSLCRKPFDAEDPTGCGGLCALDTEACQLVDKASGVRVCRLLTATCSAHEWRCRNGLCVPMDARCDGSIQCYDRSDEMYCDCDLTKQFRCGHSISCFSNTKLCDGVIDCWDGYDELNCTTECPKHQFTCTNGQCILASRFCDGLADCEDGSDEPDGCGGNCGTRELKCGNHRCVPQNMHCDGHDDCGDATDELNCSKD